MQEPELLLVLVKYVLPEELVDYFELVSIDEIEETLHLLLEERNVIPSEYSTLDLSPNGFYQESTIKDFPLCDKKVVLHVRRRRWRDAEVALCFIYNQTI